MGWWVLAYHNNTIMIPFEIQMRIDPIKLAVVYGIRQKTVTQHKNETNQFRSATMAARDVSQLLTPSSFSVC